MNESLRALIVVLALSLPVFWFLRRHITEFATLPADYRLRVGLWLGLTVLLFVGHSFWLFVLGTALVLLTFGRSDSNALGLYFFLLLLAPPFRSAIEGFGGINRLLDIDYLRLLSLVVLFPAALRLRARAGAPVFALPADKYLLAYLGLQLVLAYQISSLTDVIRTAVVLGIDVLLPYYVFSRGLIDAGRMRDTFASFVCAGAVVALMAVFEAGKGWLLYASLPEALNVHWSYGGYMFRDSALRPLVSTGHSIYLGYVMTAALGIHMAMLPAFASRRVWVAVFLLLLAGVAVPLARGPWVGALAMLAVAALMAPNAKAIYAKVLVGAIVLVPILMATPLAPKIIALLPFVGEYDAGSVDYRQQLFKASWNVLMMNPVFGSPYYMTDGSMESMRQGEGIIDMVNSYMGIALSSGLVGLAFFLGVFASSAGRIWRHIWTQNDKSSEDHIVGRALLATLVGVLATIATVGSENAVPVVYWCLAGACAAYARRSQVGLEGSSRTTGEAPGRPTSARA